MPHLIKLPCNVRHQTVFFAQKTISNFKIKVLEVVHISEKNLLCLGKSLESLGCNIVKFIPSYNSYRTSLTKELDSLLL